MASYEDIIVTGRGNPIYDFWQYAPLIDAWDFDPWDNYEVGSMIVLDAASAPQIDGVTVGKGGQIEIKSTAKIDNLTTQIKAVFSEVVQVWDKFTDITPVITSGNDSRHKVGSAHYTNNAIDLRGNNFDNETGFKIAAELRALLGPDYYVDFEVFAKNPSNDHIHIEYDPQKTSYVIEQQHYAENQNNSPDYFTQDASVRYELDYYNMSYITAYDYAVNYNPYPTWEGWG